MATGFGIDATKNAQGEVTSARTAEDERRVWGGLYSDGIVRGCTITTSASTMSYTITPGSVMIKYADGQLVPAPCYGGTINVANAPATGSRTDIIYLKQNTPTEDGNSQLILGAGPTVPLRAVELGRYQVNAGMTNTNAAIRAADRRFSVPLNYGAGVLHQWIDTFSGVHNQNLLRLGHGTINFATDRRVRLTISSLLYANGANGFDNSKYCEWYFLFAVNSGDIVKYTTPGLHQAWATYNFSIETNVLAGPNTFHYARAREVGPGEAATFYGTDGKGHGRLGTLFRVEDVGPAI